MEVCARTALSGIYYSAYFEYDLEVNQYNDARTSLFTVYDIVNQGLLSDEVGRVPIKFEQKNFFLLVGTGPSSETSRGPKTEIEEIQKKYFTKILIFFG